MTTVASAGSGTGRRSTPVLYRFLAIIVVFGAGRILYSCFRYETNPAERIPTTTTSKKDKSVQHNSNNTNKTIVAFAVTVTKLRSGNDMPKRTLYDRAAVLHQSIHMAMEQSEKYGFHLYAFVHPDAIRVKPMLEKLGYKVMVKDTPFKLSDVPSQELIDVQEKTCCGEKEYLKLYSYLLLDYPVAVHVDLDYLVLKPMDDVFDLMTDPSYDRAKFQNSVMWNKSIQQHLNSGSSSSSPSTSIDFLYTRDYNMVAPPTRRVHQIGVQGGFLVVRPSREDFQKLVDVILSGGNFTKKGWGDELMYGGYYGEGSIQGLASYYYGHLEPNRDIELNRCYYNTMVSTPVYHNARTNFSMCWTMEPDGNCQDCRQTNLDSVYTAHLTTCGKPEFCQLEFEIPLCGELLAKWHSVRTGLEQSWEERFPEYYAGVPAVGNYFDDNRTKMMKDFGGHCGLVVNPDGSLKTKYLPMVFPQRDSETILII